MTPGIDVLEHATLVAPLGVRFVDTVTRRTSVERLRVTAWQAMRPERRFPLRPGKSQVYSAHRIAGLRDFEYANDLDAALAVSGATRRFVIRVEDPESRYSEFQFETDAPTRAGLVAPACAADYAIGGAPHVPLFPRATAAIPAGLAVVRMDLRDAAPGNLAPFALVDLAVVRGGSGSGSGAGPASGGSGVGAGSGAGASRPFARALADSAGRCALVFPWPEPENPEARQRLSEREWRVRLAVRYTPRVPPLAEATLAERRRPPLPPPDLDAVFAQPPARLTADGTPATALPDQILRFGRECVVAGSGGAPLSRVVITPP